MRCAGNGEWVVLEVGNLRDRDEKVLPCSELPTDAGTRELEAHHVCGQHRGVHVDMVLQPAIPDEQVEQPSNARESDQRGPVYKGFNKKKGIEVGASKQVM